MYKYNPPTTPNTHFQACKKCCGTDKVRIKVFAHSKPVEKPTRIKRAWTALNYLFSTKLHMCILHKARIKVLALSKPVLFDRLEQTLPYQKLQKFYIW